jgi:hypothetical protein
MRVDATCRQTLTVVGVTFIPDKDTTVALIALVGRQKQTVLTTMVVHHARIIATATATATATARTTL